MKNSKPGGGDSLGDLLQFTGLGDAFDRPKSLAGMKSKAAVATPPPPSAPPAPQKTASHIDPFALDELAARVSSTPGTGSSMRSAPGSATGLSSGVLRPASTPAAPAIAASPLQESLGSPPPAGDDPFLDFLGAAPAPTSQPASASKPAAPPSGGDLLGGLDDLLGGFGSVPSAPASAPQQGSFEAPQQAPVSALQQKVHQQASYSAPQQRMQQQASAQPAASDFPDSPTWGGWSAPPSTANAVAGAEAAAAAEAEKVAAAAEAEEVERAATAAATAQAAAAAEAAQRVEQDRRPGSRGALYEQGDEFEDGPMGSAARGSQASGQFWGGGYADDERHRGTLDEPTAGQQGSSALWSAEHAQAAAEVKQKAAKMLKAGTQWFMKAGKNLVRDLQQTVAKPQGQQQRQEQQRGGGPPSYYYDWAAQLARLSPRSRSGALQAMPEDDRLVVQGILDEAALGEAAEVAGSIPPERVQPEPPRQRPPSQQGFNGREQQGFGAREEQPAVRPPSRAGSAASLGGAGPGAASLQPSPTRPPGAQPSPARPARERLGPQEQGVAPAKSVPSPLTSASAAVAAASDDLLGEGTPAKEQRAASPAKAPAAPAPSPPPAAPAEDLLGFGAAAPTPAAPAAASATPPTASSGGGGDSLLGHEEDDLLGFSSAAKSAAPAAASSATPSPARHANIESLFAVPSAGRQARAGGAVAPASMQRPAPASGLDSMIDLGEAMSAVDTTGHDELYADAEEEVDDPNEPEIRKALRRQRIQEKHRRMQQQLAEKRAREEAEAAEKAGKVELRQEYKPKVDAWAHGKKDNIRALLGSLHTVLWEGSGWTAPNMSDLVNPNKVKRIYMKANLIVHPDKVKQKGGTLEQITIADMVFDVLKVAWGKFEGSGA